METVHFTDDPMLFGMGSSVKWTVSVKASPPDGSTISCYRPQQVSLPVTAAYSRNMKSNHNDASCSRCSLSCKDH